MDYRPAVVNTVVGSWECDDADERTSSPSDDDSLLMTKSKSKVRRSKSNRGSKLHLICSLRDSSV